MKNQLSFIALVIITLVILGSIALVNHWITAQMEEGSPSSTSSQPIVQNDNKPHPPAIDPTNDPLAPMVKSKPSAPVKPAPALKKTYEAPVNGDNLAG